MEFGDKLKQLRDQSNLSREDLAIALNITYSALSKYETNMRFPDTETLKNISNYFNVSIDYLLENKIKYAIKTIPILGKIRAGIPLLATENWETEVEVAADLNADFALRITGDSMSWVGIHDGDLAILRQASTAYNGDIVACGINEGDWTATLKFFIKENETPVLRAANPNYSDIPISSNHKIIGTLISIEKNPPSISEYKRFLNAKEMSDESWNDVIEKSIQHGLDSNQVIQLIELFSHMVKQIK